MSKMTPLIHLANLNRSEIWFGTLRSKVTRWMSFESLAALKASMEAFIDDFNEAMAKPYNWTYTGKVLVASTGKCEARQH